MATLQLKAPPKNHHHRVVPDRKDARPQSSMSTETTRTVLQSIAASSILGEPHGADSDNQIAELPAGVYVCASARHKSRRDRRSTLGRRGHFDDDIEMQAPGHTRESLLDQESERQSQSQYQHHDRYRHRHRHPYHVDGAGMGYDDENGMEARIEVGTARVAHLKLIPAGTVSITNIGRNKGPVSLKSSLKSSQSVRDVVSLPDLAWAESLTTGGGRRPGVAPFAAGAPPPPPLAAATRATSTSCNKKTASTLSKEREPSKKLQERSESRRAVKKKAIKEWCARGSGGILGPYSGAC